MYGPPRLSTVLVLLVGVLTGVLAGCAGKHPPEENQAAVHLRKIAQAYDLVLYKNRRPPRNAEELKPFLQQLGPHDAPEDLLRSPNDGQPYEIVWGVNPDREANLSALLAHEKNGVDGKRYAITVGRIVKTLTEAEFKDTSYPGGKQPAGIK